MPNPALSSERPMTAHIFDTSSMYCRIERSVGDAHWGLNIDTNPEGLTRSQHMENARAVIEAGRALLTLNRPKRSTRADDALSEEVRAVIADRGWDQRTAAEEFNMAPSALSALLNGHCRWTLEAICVVATRLGGEDSLPRLMRIYEVEAGR